MEWQLNPSTKRVARRWHGENRYNINYLYFALRGPVGISGGLLSEYGSD